MNLDKESRLSAQNRMKIRVLHMYCAREVFRRKI